MIRDHATPIRMAAAVLLFGIACGCASMSAYRKGEQAERREDWDRAVIEYVERYYLPANAS